MLLVYDSPSFGGRPERTNSGANMTDYLITDSTHACETIEVAYMGDGIFNLMQRAEDDGSTSCVTMSMAQMMALVSQTGTLAH